MPPRTPDDPGTVRRARARGSFLTSLLSLSAEVLPWTRKPPPPSGREQAERGEPRAQSFLTGLLSLSAALPWSRKPPRRGEIKAAVMAALVHVDHYEDRDTRRLVGPDAPRARAVGLSYREIQSRVRAKHPGGRVSITTIRSYARDAKQQGAPLPYRRPYSRRRERGADPRGSAEEG